MFLVALTGGKLPGVTEGGWAFAVLWVVGLAATVAAKWVLVLAGPTLSRPRAALLAPGGSPLISSR